MKNSILTLYPIKSCNLIPRAQKLYNEMFIGPTFITFVLRPHFARQLNSLSSLRAASLFFMAHYGDLTGSSKTTEIGK